MIPIYGNRQILSLPGISVALEQCDFNSTEENSLGYNKLIPSSNKYSVDYNFVGTTIVRDGRYLGKYEFTWDLNLSTEKANLLKALYEEQQLLVQDYLCEIDAGNTPSTSFAITLNDGRLATLEKGAVGRGSDAATSMGITLPASPIGGWSYEWSNYFITINSLEQTPFMPNQDLISVRMTASELDINTTSSDIL